MENISLIIGFVYVTQTFKFFKFMLHIKKTKNNRINILKKRKIIFWSFVHICSYMDKNIIYIGLKHVRFF